MCMNLKKSAVSEGRLPYQLYDSDLKGTCLKDERFDVFGSKGELDIFLENSVIFSYLPRFTVSNQFQYHLFTRGVIEFKPSCLA